MKKIYSEKRYGDARKNWVEVFEVNKKENMVELLLVDKDLNSTVAFYKATIEDGFIFDFVTINYVYSNHHVYDDIIVKALRTYKEV